MINDQSPYTLDRLVRLALGAGVVWALVWLAGTLADVLVPFAAALLAAYLINPLVERLARLLRRRGPAVFAALALVGLAGMLLVLVVAPLVGAEVRHMGALLRELVQGSELAARAADRLPPDVWQAVRDLAARPEVQEMFLGGDPLALAQAVAAKVLPGVRGVLRGAVGLAGALAGLVVVLLYVVFLLLDYERLSGQWTRALPPRHRGWITALVEDFRLAMGRYFRAQALVAALVGVLFAVGFTLIGLPLGILLGLFIGLLNMVPYLQIAGFIPAFFLGAMHALETGAGLWTTLALIGAVFLTVQLIQDAVLVPRIMGSATGLSPAFILLSLSVWGKLLGMLGLLIAIPMTCLCWAWYQRLITGGATPPPARSPPPGPHPAGGARTRWGRPLASCGPGLAAPGPTPLPSPAGRQPWALRTK